MVTLTSCYPDHFQFSIYGLVKNKCLSLNNSHTLVLSLSSVEQGIHNGINNNYGCNSFHYNIDISNSTTVFIIVRLTVCTTILSPVTWQRKHYPVHPLQLSRN